MQVSRLANPLFNEVLIPMAAKDAWNGTASRSKTGPSSLSVQHPELAKLLPVLYPGVFPNLEAFTRRVKTSWRSC